jgi:hypothetical protein
VCGDTASTVPRRRRDGMSKGMLADSEVAALGELSRVDLAEQWARAYHHPPPKGARRDFLLRAAAWHSQASRLGGLPAETRRMLRAATSQRKKRFAAAPEASAPAPAALATSEAVPRMQLTPGTRLVRDWNGRSYVVDVLEEGFAFEGRLHKSLTAIACQITGAHWSGPRFFGL